MEPSTTSFIVQSLTQAIAGHRLQPGTKLPEQKLADHFGVSRTLVRQALFQLAQNRLVFDGADYFQGRGMALPDPAFLDQVTLDFGIAHPQQRYHVPLLVRRWSYSTYRGS